MPVQMLSGAPVLAGRLALGASRYSVLMTIASNHLSSLGHQQTLVQIQLHPAALLFAAVLVSRTKGCMAAQLPVCGMQSSLFGGFLCLEGDTRPPAERADVIVAMGTKGYTNDHWCPGSDVWVVCRGPKLISWLKADANSRNDVSW